MESLRGASEVISPSPLTSNVKIKCLTGTHIEMSRFPKLNECAHFHYEITELGSIQVSLCEDKPIINQEIKNYITVQPSDDRIHYFYVSVKTNDKSWILRRSYDDFHMLDKQVHRCIYDRKYSQLPELPISEELLDFISLSKHQDLQEDGLRTMLAKYLDRFSILAGNLINCGPVLNWFELDNRGNRLLVPEESAINTPAVGAAYVIKRYSAQATDEISFEVGDMVSVIDMPPPEDSIWWRGKRGFQVGFFPCDCVEIICEKIPKNISIPKKCPTKPVLRKQGKLITFFRSFILTRPSRRKLKQRGILKERVFGCDLGEHLLNSGHDIPTVLKSCTEFIEEYGIVDGIYRLSGVTSNIQKLRVAFDEERVPDLHDEAIRQDIHCVASLLKMYFRELPNPLLTYQLYDKYVCAVQSNEDVRLIKMRDIVHQLPPPHYRTLEYLIKHLSRVSSHGNNTGMGPKNVAIVWAPNLLRSKDLEGGSVAALHVVGVQAVLTEYLIRYCDLIFNDKMPNFISNSSHFQNEEESPRKARPKSLALCTPTKLLSLEEARSRALTSSLLESNNQTESKYIEVGGGPSNLPAKYHTVIDLPAGKRGSGKLKKSPMGWKSFFSKSRHPSGGSHREKSNSKDIQFQHQFSLNSSFQEGISTNRDVFSQNKRLRTVKSAESLVSSLDYSNSNSEDIDESASEYFKYSPLVSSHSRLCSEEPSESQDSMVDRLVTSSDLDTNMLDDQKHSNYNVNQMDHTDTTDENVEKSNQVEEMRKIKIEIGDNRISENSVVEHSCVCDVGLKNIQDNKFESTSPKSHKFSLRQKFRQAFTSPPSIRRISQSSDDSYFKRQPSSFREKIVKTFSPESLRKKQSDCLNCYDDGVKLSPMTKQRKKANIEEDLDSPEQTCQDQDMIDPIDELCTNNVESPDCITSPDSTCGPDGVNETVTVEVHAVEGSPAADLSEFEKSFLTKSEKSLLEEVTSELAHKASSVFTANEEVKREEMCDEKSYTNHTFSLEDEVVEKPVCQIMSPQIVTVSEVEVPGHNSVVMNDEIIDDKFDDVFEESSHEPTSSYDSKISVTEENTVEKVDANFELFPCFQARNEIDFCTKNRRVNSWTATSCFNEFKSFTSRRERWSYPLPERFSPLESSKRKFESEIGREIVRDRRMKHELEQIQIEALNFKNSQNVIEPFIISAGSALPFHPHPLKSIQSSDICLPEPAEADEVSLESVGDLPEICASTGSVSSDTSSVDEIVECTTKIRNSVSSPHRSLIPRIISPIKLHQSHFNETARSLSPVINNQDSVELRRCRKSNGTPDQKHIRNSDPNGFVSKSPEKLSDNRNKRHSEPEIMANSFPPTSSYLRKSETKTSVKELLNKFEIQPAAVQVSKSSQINPNSSSKSYKNFHCIDKAPLTSPRKLAYRKSFRSAKSLSHPNNHSGLSDNSTHKRCAFKQRTKSADISSSSDILENNNVVVISGKTDDAMVKQAIVDVAPKRPTTLLDKSESSVKLEDGDVTSAIDGTSQVSIHSDSDKCSPALSPLSPSSLSNNSSVDIKSLLSSIGETSDGGARRERINKYKEERRAQLREKIKIDCDNVDDVTSPTRKKNWQGSSPSKCSYRKSSSSSTKNSYSDDFKNYNSSCSSPYEDNQKITIEVKPEVNDPLPSNENEKKVSYSEKDIVIIENIPSSTTVIVPSKIAVAKPKVIQQKKIQGRLAMFEKR